MAVTTTAIFTLIPRYSCKDTKVPHGGTITSTLKVTRKTSSLVISLVTQGSGSQGCRAGVGLWGVLVGERSGTVGQEKQKVKGGERSGLPGLGGGPGAQGQDRQRYQSSLLCVVQSRNLKLSCAGESRWWHRGTPKATDFFLEAVKVIDLNRDRLKDNKSLSRKEIKLLLLVSIAFYLGRGLNVL